MADIQIISGIATEVSSNGAGFAFNIGTPPISLTIGAFPTKNTPEGSQPIDDHDYIAVAVRRSAFQGSGYELLSFRRVGQRGPAHAANFTLAAWVVVLSVGGAVASVLVNDLTTGLGYSACFVLLTIPCVLRLLSVRRATRLLQEWQPPI